MLKDIRRVFGLCVALCVVISLFAGCSSDVEYVRDMSEIASRGSFVYFMGNNKDRISDMGETLVFNTYDEFCANDISNTILYTSGHNNDKKEWIVEEYKAKNERYNSDYFEENSLLIAFFYAEPSFTRHIINNVTFSGTQCEIEVVGCTGISNYTTDDDISPFACFVETSAELSTEIVATIDVKIYNVSEDSGLFCYYDENSAYIDAADESIIAYYLPTYAAMTEFIEDNEYLVENGITSITMRMKYNEDFFSGSALLFVQLPAKYRGYMLAEDSVLSGFRFDTDHYVMTDIAEQSEELLKHTSIGFVAMPKADIQSFTYSFQSYSEWEEGVTAENTVLDAITLTRVENAEKEYIVYM